MRRFCLGIVIGIIIASGITVLASTILARDISYNNTNVESALNDLYSKAEQNGASISDDIDDFNPEIKYANGTYITVKIPNNISNNSSVAGYVYLLNGNAVGFTKDNEYSYMNLQMSTTYTVSVIAVDETGSIKHSGSINSSTKDKLYLYDEREECSPITGGWGKTGYDGTDAGTITKNSDSMYVYAPVGSRIFCGTANKVDLSNYTKLYIQKGTSTQNLFQITQTSYYNRNAGSDLSYNSSYYNITNYNGGYYFHITTANGGYQNIEKIWVE